MDKLLNNLHYLILLYGAWTLYSGFTDYEENLERKTRKVPSLKKQIKKTQRKLKEIEQYQVEIENFEEGINKLNDQMGDLKKKIPTEDNSPEVLEDLSRSARKINMEVSFSPKYLISGEVYSTNGISLKGKGTFLQLLVFLEKILYSERIINIKELEVQNKLTSRGRFNIIDSELILETFRYTERKPPPKKDPQPAPSPKKRRRKK